MLGSDALTLKSSMTLPLSTGTLKSNLATTFFPPSFKLFKASLLSKFKILAGLSSLATPFKLAKFTMLLLGLILGLTLPLTLLSTCLLCWCMDFIMRRHWAL